MTRNLSYDGRNKAFAKKLRREMTKQERHLWYDYLRACPAKFHRQKQFGYYIVDFYCAALRLVVEVDVPSITSRRNARGMRRGQPI